MKTVLLCLHGWGGSKESFTELRAALAGSDIEILTPDLPGFGDEPEPSRAWTVDDYADWVVHWLSNKPFGSAQDRLTNEQTNRPLFLLGHSHGGRIAIKLATRPALQPSDHPTIRIDHLFLCAAAGIRRPRHFKRILGLTLAKSGRFLLSIPGMKKLQPLGKKFLYKLVRVHDYEKASPLMQQTMIKVTAEDLTPLLSKITIPTDLFWGEDDGMTPIADGRLMHERINGSTLHTYKGVRHGVHRDRAREIADAVRKNT